MVRDLDLDLGSGQGHINIHSTCRTTSVPKHVTVASRITEIRPFEFRGISTIGEVWTLVIAFLAGNSKIGLRQAVLPTVSFELHAKVAEETDLEMCSYGQLSEVQMLHDLDLDLGLGQGHINIDNTCSTTSLPNHVTVASRSTEIWPFEFREISTLDEVWTLVIAILEFKNRAPTSCSTGPILWPSTISFELHAKTAEEIDLEKCTFRNFGSSVTLT